MFCLPDCTLVQDEEAAKKARGPSSFGWVGKGHPAKWRRMTGLVVLGILLGGLVAWGETKGSWEKKAGQKERMDQREEGTWVNHHGEGVFLDPHFKKEVREHNEMSVGGPDQIGRGLNCSHIFKEHNISDSFGPAVAHSIHSLTLNDLRHYFSSSAPLANYVPVVDLNLTSSTPVLAHAPLLQDNTNFNSLGLKIADRVLSHMDNNMYDVKNFNGLERIIHTLHMHEMWESARPFYKSLVTNPADPTLCKCAVDVENNGVMKNLRLNALKIREPEAFYKPSKGGKGYDVGYVVSYNHAFHAALDTGDELKEAMRQLVDQESWDYWRNTMEENDDMKKYHEWLGIFLHCKIH